MNKKIVNKIIKTIFTAGIVPAVGNLIVCMIFYRATQQDMRPVYAVSPPVAIASSPQQLDSLQVFWAGDEIDDVGFVNVAIWNRGKGFMDRADISATNPLRLENSSVRILAAHVVDKSRNDLPFKTRIVSDTLCGQCVAITIEGDEGFEHFDGASFNVIYAGDSESNWRVKGRIKGIPGGVEEMRWRPPLAVDTPARIANRILFAEASGVPILFLLTLLLKILPERRRAKSRIIRVPSYSEPPPPPIMPRVWGLWIPALVVAAYIVYRHLALLGYPSWLMQSMQR